MKLSHLIPSLSIEARHVTIILMKKQITYTITEKNGQMAVKDFLLSIGCSHHVIACLKRSEGGILVNGEQAGVKNLLFTGDILSLSWTEPPSSAAIVPVPMDLNIIYEDDDLMVINKAAGLPVHPSQGNFDNTLANGVAHYFLKKDESFTFRAVNRLDRDTTGLLILAKHMLSAAILYPMAAKKEIRRDYLAIVTGLSKEEGSICLPIARKEGSVIERCVDIQRGEYALTHYKRLFYDEEKDCSLLLITLATGRTHQIRVHMKQIGHPLLGDFLYNPDYRFIKRQSLHSYRLSFPHPLTGKHMEFTAPLPEDFYFLSPLG